MYKNPLFSISLIAFITSSVFDNSRPHRCEAAATCGSGLCLIVTQSASLCTFWSSVCVAFGNNNWSFSHFLIELFGFFMLYQYFLYFHILDIDPFSDR